MFVLAVTLVVAGPALAQIDPTPDGLGIYFDIDGTINCLPDVTPGEYGPGFMYLMITNPSEPSGISGWELQLVFDSCLLVTDWGYQAGAINSGTEPDFYVTQPTPLPSAATVILLDMTFYVLCSDCALMYIYPPPVQHVPDFPAYSAGNDPNEWFALHQSTGGSQFPVAAINCICDVISNDNATWGSLKTMYR
jgi:hypothetical protein